MNEQDQEIEQLKAGVSCAVLLERLPPVWQLDRAESTRRSLKYRRGAGEILIVNHDGHGWWDPLSDRKGDIFSLVRHLDPGLSFAAACRLLRDFVAIAPAFPEAVRSRRTRGSRVPIPERWGRRRPLSRGSPAWCFLIEQRGLPESILIAARAADAAREGPRGSAWFAHRDGAGVLTGIEMRGGDYRNFSAGGGKTLFRLPGGRGRLSRVAVSEVGDRRPKPGGDGRRAAGHAVCRDRRRDGTGHRRRARTAPAGSCDEPGGPAGRRHGCRHRRPPLRRSPGTHGDRGRGAVRSHPAA